VALPPLSAAKIGLYRALRAAGVSVLMPKKGCGEPAARNDFSASLWRLMP